MNKFRIGNCILRKSVVMQSLFALFLFLHLNSYCQNAVYTSGTDRVVPFPEKSVTLTASWVKHREDLNTEYLRSLDPDRLLHNFRVNAGLPSDATPLEGWEAPGIGLRGHFTGHYLSAVSIVVEKYQDPLLAKRLDYMVDELYKCQQVFGTGYLSAFPEKDFDILETRFGQVWAPYYTYHKIMQGLLDVYIRTGNKKAGRMVSDMTVYVGKRMSALSDETIEKVLYSAGANPSNEAGAMNEVLYKLYKVTRDPEHLALAKIFDRDWFAGPLSENRDILSGLHSNTHLVLVNGFAQRYSVTNEKKYHDAAVNFWEILMKSHAYVNGSSSGPRPNVTTPTSLSAEHWGVPGQLSSTMTRETSESCVSHNTQKLTSALFTWTADPVYADAYMNTFYNSTLALQSGYTGRCVYHLPLGSPRKKAFLKENDFRCCNGSSIEAFSLLNSGIYYHDDSEIFVNLYVPSIVRWNEKEVELEQTGNFPEDTCVSFEVSARKETSFTLKLLAPSWAGKAELWINNEKQDIDIIPGSYISINRLWKNNDIVRLVFQYEFYIKTMPDDRNVIAIFYGPVLLAFEDTSELILKGDHKEVLNSLSKENGGFTFHLDNNGKSYLLRPLYDIEEQSYGVYATIRNY
jgi:DUF1680 family protein